MAKGVFHSKSTKTSIIGIIIRLAILIALVYGFLYAQSNYIVCSDIVYENQIIPKNFVGYKIVQISDVCNKPMNTYDIINKIQPDLVVFTGNLSDKNGRFNKSVDLINKVSKSYQSVYVLGELDENQYDDIIRELDKSNAENLISETFTIKPKDITVDKFIDTYIEKWYRKNEDDPDSYIHRYIEYVKKDFEEDKDKHIRLIGLDLCDSDTDFIDYICRFIDLDDEEFRLVVASQSQYAEDISQNDVQIILTGNTFGVDRFNNEYSKGIYYSNNTMISISAGLGENPDGSARFLNFPQVISITLSDGTINTDNPLQKLLARLIPNIENRFSGDAGFSEYTYEYSSDKKQQQ